MYRQLVLLCDLFDTEYLERHVYPVALALAEDKVSEVRGTATIVVRLHVYTCAIALFLLW